MGVSSETQGQQIGENEVNRAEIVAAKVRLVRLILHFSDFISIFFGRLQFVRAANIVARARRDKTSVPNGR